MAMGHGSWVMWVDCVMGHMGRSHGSWITKDDPFPSLNSKEMRCANDGVTWEKYAAQASAEVQLRERSRIQLENMAKKFNVMFALRGFTDAELLWQHAKISLPWQQGPVRVQFVWYHNIVWLLKIPLWYKNLAHISYISQVIANFMSK